jgi:plastocyanin
MMRSSLAFCLLLALAPLIGCTVGEITGPGGLDGDGDGSGDGSGDGDGEGSGGGDGDGDGGATPTVSLEVLPPLAEMTLGTSSTFDVIVTAENYSGSVTLALQGAPGSWQVALDSPTLSFTGSGSLAGTMTVTVPPSGDAGAINAMLVATASMGPSQTAVQFDVEKALLVPIRDGVGAAGAHGFPQDITIKSGTVVRFVNYDTLTGHTIHANGGDAFPHEDDQMARALSAGQAGGTYEITTGPSGIYDFYCHDHGENTGIGLITVAP